MKVVAAGERSAPITLGGVARRAPVVVMVGQRGPAGAGGVATFNGRLGSVTLIGADVTTALGYTPQDGGSLSAVAFSGDYADLLGAPAIPSTPADIGAATAAQGALAASAVQPDALDTALADKVDKVAGYGLSQESYTSAEKTKLAGLEGSHFKGLFASLAALELALPSAVAGDYADVDAGVGSDTVRYLWDVDDVQWVASGSGAPLTAADVKSLYESNPDTNAYTDAEQTKLGAIEAGAQVNAAAVSQAEAEAGTGTALRSWTVQRVWQAIAAWWAASAMKTKLDGIATGATANSPDATLLARSNHTGTQAASTISDLTEVTQDVVGAMIVAGTNVSVSYDDVAGTLTISATGGGSGMTNPMTTAGDIITGGAAGAAQRLAAGVNGQRLTMVSGAPAWVYDLGATITESTTARNAALTDVGNYLRHTNASASTLTIPPQSSVAWPADAEIHVRRAAAGNLTLTPGSGVTLNAPSGGTLVLTNNMTVTLKRVASNVWDVIGQTVAA